MRTKQLLPVTLPALLVSCILGPPGWTGGESQASSETADSTEASGSSNSNSGPTMASTTSEDSADSQSSENTTEDATGTTENATNTTESPTAGETTDGGTGQATDESTVGTTSCEQLDILLVLDAEDRVSTQRNQIKLGLGQIFNGIEQVSEISDYRIGITHDKGGSLVVPAEWGYPHHWVDSTLMSHDEMENALASVIDELPSLATPSDCEQPLTSAVKILASNEGSVFLRNDAPLVIILLGHTDDYPLYYYDNNSPCDLIECDTPDPIPALISQLSNEKGSPELITAVVFAGEPEGSETDTCNRPASCGCLPESDYCTVYDAPRLKEFADTLGSQAVFNNLCEVDNIVPDLVNALHEVVEPVCENL